MFGDNPVGAVVLFALLLLIVAIVARIRRSNSPKPISPEDAHRHEEADRIPDAELHPVHRGKAHTGGCKFDKDEVRRTFGQVTPPIDLSNLPPADARIVRKLQCVQLDEIRELLYQFTGVKPVYVNGESVRILSRSTHGKGVYLAMSLLEQFYGSLKIKARRIPYKRQGKQHFMLEATIEGKNPSKGPIFVLGSHLDSTAGNTWQDEKNAPGADDDASGTVGVLKIAELIRDLNLDCTVRILHFTGEEQGLWASYAYSDMCAKAGEKVKMYQFDMIGFCRNTEHRLDVHDNIDQNGSHELVVAMARAVAQYGINLKIFDTHNHAVQDRSDHAGFLDHGYPAVLVSEEFSDEGFNPNYHSTRDTVEKQPGSADFETGVNLPFMCEVIKAGIATIANMAGLPPASVR